MLFLDELQQWSSKQDVGFRQRNHDFVTHLNYLFFFKLQVRRSLILNMQQTSFGDV